MVMQSCLEDGSRATIYMWEMMLPVRFSCRCLVTHAVKRMLKRGCLTLLHVEGAKTRFTASLLLNQRVFGYCQCDPVI